MHCDALGPCHCMCCARLYSHQHHERHTKNCKDMWHILKPWWSHKKKNTCHNMSKTMTCCFEEERRKPSQKLRPMRRTALYINVIHRYTHTHTYIYIYIYARIHAKAHIHTHVSPFSLSLSLSLFLFLCISVHQCHHSLRALLEVLAGHKLPNFEATSWQVHA